MKTFSNHQWKKAGGILKMLCAVCLGMSLTGMAQETAPLRTAAELEALLAPVALYPDDLIAVMLPAATAPADIVLAARYNAAAGDAAQLEEQGWDDSVRTLAHYTELTQWMSDNLEWTRAVGEAFRSQPADVMTAIQRLRTKAQAVGNLTTTPQQRVINDQNTIMIVPAEPEVIYVPQYDPQLVYVEPAPFGCSWISFGFSWRFGGWHRYDFDWRRCDVRIRERHQQWRNPVEVIHAWHPAPVAVRPNLTNHRPTSLPQPRPFAVAGAPIGTPTAPVFGQINRGQPRPPVTQPATQVKAPMVNTREHSNNHDRGEINRNVIQHTQQPQPAVTRSLPTPAAQPHEVTVRTPKPVVTPPTVRDTPRPAFKFTPTPTPVVRASEPAAPTPRREVTVRAPTPVISQPIVRETARQEIKFTQNLPPIVRQNTPAMQEPRVMRAAPAVAQPVVRAEVRAPQSAPTPRGNQPAGGSFNTPSSGDRSSGGRWGNLATRGN